MLILAQVMIRPRIGSFVYSDDELRVMSLDIEAFAEEGVEGFVFGCLTTDGMIDMMAMKT